MTSEQQILTPLLPDGKPAPAVMMPLLVSCNDAARLLGLSKSAFYEGLSSGRIGPVGIYFGTKRLFSVEELEEYVRAGCPGRREWLKRRGG